MSKARRKSPSAPPPAWKRAGLEMGAPLLLCAAGWAAHGGCLHATFFLDDWSQIVNVPPDGGNGAAPTFKGLTEGSYQLLGRSAFACHLGNLLLHFLLTCLIWWLGPLFFRHAPGRPSKAAPRLAAFLGALVFAVHPLCSEITHYARARDHELVGLFAFLTAAPTLLWLKRGWRWLPAVLGAALLAALAKGPGPAHAALAIAAVLLFYGTQEELRRRLLHRGTLYALIVLPLAALALAPGPIFSWVEKISGSWGNGLFGLHFLTQCRVFWEYAARMAWPTGLCPDHLVPYTKNAGDASAWLGLAGIAAWMGVVVLLWRRGRRLAAFLLFMVAANLWLRWFYVLSELMVEYRTYPSMPWLGLLAGLGLARLYAWRRAACLIVAAGLLVAGIALTRQRSAAWASSETLTATILAQYPWQLRAVMEQTYLDYLHRDADAAVARLPDFYARLRAVLDWNRNSPDRTYANWPLWAVSVECNVADCLIRANRLDEAAALLHRTRLNMDASGFTDDVLWDSWYLERAKIENRTGAYGWARWHLRKMGDWFFDPADYDAELKQADAGLSAGRPAALRPPARR